MSTNAAEQHLQIARRYSDIGEDEIAELAYRKALQLEPGNTEALGVIAGIEKRRGVAAPTAARPFAVPVSPAADVVVPPRDAVEKRQGAVAKDWFSTVCWWSGSTANPALAGRADGPVEQWIALSNPESEEMLRGAAERVDRAPDDPAAWEFAADVFQRSGMTARGLEFRVRASVLRGEPTQSRGHWARELSERADRGRAVPNVILFNVPNSGASAIDPILRDLLASEFGVELMGGPHNSHTLGRFMPGATPFYHWTHSASGDLSGSAALGNTRVLCVYRDPRDVLVSHAKDPANQPAWKHLSTREVLHFLIGTNFPGLFAIASEWMAMDPKRVFAFRFDELKQDVAAMVGRILDFLEISIAEDRIHRACEAYSFERLTGRARGSEGPSKRGVYLVRRGVAGDWRSHFDQELAKHFIAHCGRFLIEWGFEPDHSWADGLPKTLESVERQP